MTKKTASYRAGFVPLVVPVTLLRHHVRRHGIEYLAQQTYLAPHPAELILRNHRVCGTTRERNSRGDLSHELLND